MEKRKKILALVLGIALFAAVLLTGCTPSEPAATDSAESSSAAQTEESQAQQEESSEATEESSATAEESEPLPSGEVHEVYAMLPNLSFSGVTSPYIEDRAALDKAWPKEPANPDQITIGWTEMNQASDWFVAVKRGAETRAEELGFKLELLVADNDAATQSQHVDTFISQGVDIIVVDPVNSSTPIADINRAVEAGIPVICIGNVPDECSALTTLAFNPFMNGFECGKYAGAQYAADEDIISAAIIGLMGNSTSESRTTGMISGVLSVRMEQNGQPFASDEDAWLAGYHMFQDLKSSGKASDEAAGFYINGMGTGDWTVEGGLAAAEDLLTANPDMNFLIAENDFMAAGALKALQSTGMVDQVKMAAAADGTTVGLEMIMDGTLMCTGPTSGDAQGEWPVDFIDAIFNQGKDPNDLPLGSYFESYAITKDNVEELYDADAKFHKVDAFVFPQSIPEIKAAAGVDV